ncbi:tRNA (N6-isopentenyl adenosine(37)-C2)-methylthiotransferase MiaB [Spirochaetia bacterium 38H-sp]|uniref:tRNA-2-methylthio-N(6)-dimethylallyladenosine synthase n=1 Tax=Rarispira pelagica TaxID=3141764 RepID=A0ABU9UCK9_9SPIR
MQKYWIETYGCQMNKAESDAIIRQLKHAGWKEASGPEDADIAVINTCSVRETAEERIEGRLGFYGFLKSKRNSHLKLALMGCMAERLKEEIIERFPQVDVVVGTFNKKKFVELLTSNKEDLTLLHDFLLTEQDEYSFEKIHHSDSAYKAFVPIMHGCNNFCSYCIVPYVRGREISRNPSDIFKEIETLLNDGVKEITLLGQNVNSYRYTEGSKTLDFASLLNKICEKFPELPWLRFLTSHPKDLSQDIVDVMAENRAICRHIHLPVQHGSDDILKRMNRRYTSSHYMSLIYMLRKAMPDISITTDILIGFPGETEDDVEMTLSLMREAGFSDSYMYYYNPRKGTKAYEWEDTIPIEEKKHRLAKVIELQKELSYNWRKKKIGKRLGVLVESVSKKDARELLARTEQDEMLVFAGDKSKIGDFTTVEILSLEGNTFKAREV